MNDGIEAAGKGSMTMTTTTQKLSKLHLIAHAVRVLFPSKDTRQTRSDAPAPSYFEAPTSADVMTRLHINAHYGG